MLKMPRIFFIGFFLVGSIACKSRPASELQHAESNIALQLPAYIWQASSEQDLKKLLNASNPEILSPKLAINKRLQAITDVIDREIRKKYPMQSENIPKPLVLIYRDMTANGYNQAKDLFIRQKIRVNTPSSEKKHPQTLDLNHPGFVEEIELPTATATSSDNKIIDKPEELKGWNAAEFVDLWNSKLPTDRQACQLRYNQSGIEFLANPECPESINGDYDYIKIAVHSDIIFLSTELLRTSTEASVIAFLAHEMGHYYQGHVSTIGHNPEYFFIQTAENELRKPAPTDLYPELRQSLWQAKSLFVKVEPIPGARLSPNIFVALDGLYNDLAETICAQDKSCGTEFEQLKTLYDGEVRRTIYEPLNEGKSIAPKDYPTYLAFEKQLLAVLDQLTVKSLDPVKLVNYTKNIRIFGLHSFFKELPETKKMAPWLIAISKSVDQVIANEKKAFVEAAKVGLGFYTDEELADEISAEISANLGLTKQQVTAVWWQLLEDDEKRGRLTWQDMTVRSCQQLQANNWQAEGRQTYPLVLLGRLDDIHHSFCYRIFNLEREWAAHNYDQKLNDTKPDLLDEKQWKSLISEI